MTTVVATHAVGDMDTWLAGGSERQELFKGFSSGYRIFRHAEKGEVSIVLEGVDLDLDANLDWVNDCVPRFRLCSLR